MDRRAKTQHDEHDRLLPAVLVSNPSPERASGQLTHIEGADEVSGVVSQLLLVHLLLTQSVGGNGWEEGCGDEGQIRIEQSIHELLDEEQYE